MTGAIGLFLMVWALAQLFCAWLDRTDPALMEIPTHIRHFGAFVIGCLAGLVAVGIAMGTGMLR